MYQPTAACAIFCAWMLDIASQRLSGPQRTVVLAIQAAAIAQTPVTETQWLNFNLFAAWRKPYFDVYNTYASLTTPSLLTGLLSSYSFEGNSTDATGAANGTDTAITYGAGTGKILQGASFNGTTSKITTGGIASSTTFTVALWFNVSAAGGGLAGILQDSAQNYGLNISRATSKVQFSANVVSAVSAVISYATWTCCLVTCSAGVLNIYINNVLSGTAGSLSLSQNFNRIGLFQGGNNFNGTLDILSIWNRVLTADERTAFYNLNVGVQYPF